VQEGLCLVNAMHITARRLYQTPKMAAARLDVWLEKLAPHEPVSQYSTTAL